MKLNKVVMSHEARVSILVNGIKPLLFQQALFSEIVPSFNNTPNSLASFSQKSIDHLLINSSHPQCPIYLVIRPI
ncbi:hypothetical protein [Nostoc sp. WHI]|uniref:hypothetical protein n=1 Tax=Nostoc sp. WHI TaxID=2650611 RepID=UPI0018C63482|nr:hypothetical protein [Nostoc sp. WHI]MBG1268910.1 hypothetical protein [Nostoc sp. WHI]